MKYAVLFNKTRPTLSAERTNRQTSASIYSSTQLISTTHHRRHASPASHSVAPSAPPPIHPPDSHSRCCSACRGHWRQTSRPSSCSPRYPVVQAAAQACGRPCWAAWRGVPVEQAWPLRWWRLRRRWGRGWGLRGAQRGVVGVRFLVLRLLVPRGRLRGSSLGWRLSCSCRATSLTIVRYVTFRTRVAELTVSFL